MKTSESNYCKCLYFASGAMYRKIEKLANESWKPVGLSPSHGYLLMLVNKNPGMQPTSLCEQLQLSPSTITRLIEKLEDKKLVIRTTEGKLTNVYPTPKGKALQPELESAVKHFYETYAAVLGKEESARLVQDLNKISDKL